MSKNRSKKIGMRREKFHKMKIWNLNKKKIKKNGKKSHFRHKISWIKHQRIYMRKMFMNKSKNIFRKMEI